MINNKMNILVVAGGSGGHIFPALETMNRLSNVKNKLYIIDTYFITDERGAQFVPNTIKKLVILKTITVTLKSVFAYFRNFFKLLYIFYKIRPNILIGFGGITTIIPAFVAWIFGVRIFIHEQNATIGKANRFILKYFNARCFLSFKNTKGISDMRSASYVNFPVRSNIKQKGAIVDYDTKNEIGILIIAGSQGADFFDNNIPNIISKVFSENPNIPSSIRIKIYEQVHIENHEKVKNIYSKLGIDVEIKTFFDNIDEYILKSDLMIARAGASTIFEILASKIPSILIPLKNSADNHQYLNAVEFSKIQTKIQFIEEDAIGNLYDILKEVFTSKKLLIEAQKELLNFKSNVNSNIEQNVLKVL